MVKVALVNLDFRDGGVATTIKFLYQYLQNTGQYCPELITTAVSATDSSSVLLRSPKTWSQGIRVERGDWLGIPCRHVGAFFSEFEFQRYQPRDALDEILSGYDLVQFISGAPNISYAAERLTVPKFLWAATMTWPDRSSRVERMPLVPRMLQKANVVVCEMLERRALEQMDFVFSNGYYGYDLYRHYLPEEKVGVAISGMDTKLFAPSSDAKGNYILSVGRFYDHRKNIRLLITAYLSLLRKRGKDATPDLYLAGGLPEKSVLQWIAEEGVSDKILTFENLPLNELIEMFRRSQFYVHSADEEGLGMVLLEAMSCGRAVVSTQCGGPKTLVIEGVTGYLVPIKDASALAMAMERLMNDPALAERMGQAGRKRVERFFSMEASGKIFTDKYEEVLSSRGRSF